MTSPRSPRRRQLFAAAALAPTASLAAAGWEIAEDGLEIAL